MGDFLNQNLFTHPQILAIEHPLVAASDEDQVIKRNMYVRRKQTRRRQTISTFTRQLQVSTGKYKIVTKS